MKSLSIVSLSLMIGALVAGPAYAQTEFEMSHTSFLRGANAPRPRLELKAAFQPNVGLEDSSAEADLIRVNARGFKLFGVNDNVAILGAMNFGLRDYTFDNAGALGQDLDESLYEFAGEMGVNWFVTEDLMMAVVFRPGIFSDLDEDLEADDWQFQGNALGTYRLNEKWFLKLGLAVGEDFDETQVIPLGGFSYVDSDSLRVDILLPRSATVTWRPFDDRSLLVIPGLYLEGQQYHIEVAGRDGDIQVQDVRADITVRYDIVPGAQLSISAGSNFRGEYEVEGDRGFDADADQDPSLYLAVGFGATF